MVTKATKEGTRAIMIGTVDRRRESSRVETVADTKDATLTVVLDSTMIGHRPTVVEADVTPKTETSPETNVVVSLTTRRTTNDFFF